MGHAKDFCEALAGDGPLTWQSFDDKGQQHELTKIFHGTLDQVWRIARELNTRGAGIFVAVNQTDLHGRRADNVTALRALFVDDDSGSLTGIDIPLEPSFIVHSANGDHLYWLLSPGERLGEFTPAQKHLAGYLGTDPKVCDLPRVMRVPGFFHHKRNPVRVRFEPKSARRHTISEVLTAFPVAHDASRTVRWRRATATGDQIADRAKRYLSKIPPATQGSRDNTAYVIACRLVTTFALDEQLATDLLEDWNQRCSPPLESEKIKAKVFNAIKYAQRKY